MVIVWLRVILILVIFIGTKILFRTTKVTVLRLDSSSLEVVWTLIPIVILLLIAFPSIYLLCLQDDPQLVPKDTLKILRNQWNWQSERLEQLDHLLDTTELDVLISYDSPLALSVGERSRFLLTSRDVLHSIGVPSLGIKLDSSPGRLNVVILEITSLGLLRGSCYELCGRGHSAIPFCLLVC